MAESLGLSQPCVRRALSLAPLLLPDDYRGVGRLSLLSIALRLLVVMPCVVWRNLQHAGARLKGI